MSSVRDGTACGAVGDCQYACAIHFDDMTVGTGRRKVPLECVAVEVDGDALGAALAYLEMGRQRDI